MEKKKQNSIRGSKSIDDGPLRITHTRNTAALNAYAISIPCTAFALRRYY